MAKGDAKWQDWGMRLRIHIKRKSSLAKVAEKMGLAEVTLRSWTNGTREINLVDFFELCAAAGADPAVILFGAATLSQEQHKAIRDLANTLSPAPNQPQ